jgi:hypothetical protein
LRRFMSLFSHTLSMIRAITSKGRTDDICGTLNFELYWALLVKDDLVIVDRTLPTRVFEEISSGIYNFWWWVNKAMADSLFNFALRLGYITCGGRQSPLVWRTVTLVICVTLAKFEWPTWNSPPTLAAWGFWRFKVFNIYANNVLQV